MAGYSMESFIEWCREQREVALRGLAMMEKGDLKLHSNGVDISEGHMKLLRRVISDMDVLIAEHGSRND